MQSILKLFYQEVIVIADLHNLIVDIYSGIWPISVLSLLSQPAILTRLRTIIEADALVEFIGVLKWFLKKYARRLTTKLIPTIILHCGMSIVSGCIGHVEIKRRSTAKLSNAKHRRCFNILTIFHNCWKSLRLISLLGESRSDCLGSCRSLGFTLTRFSCINRRKINFDILRGWINVRIYLLRI